MADVDPVPDFARYVARPDAEINLAEAALLLARTEYPELDMAAGLAHLDRLAAQLPADPTYSPLTDAFLGEIKVNLL